MYENIYNDLSYNEYKEMLEDKYNSGYNISQSELARLAQLKYEENEAKNGVDCLKLVKFYKDIEENSREMYRTSFINKE